MGGLATYTGIQLWKMFLGLDSIRYPIKSYGDVAFRVFGPVARHVVNVLQSIQLIVNVGIIVLGSGQALAQLANNPAACFSVLVMVFAIVGMLLGQIQSLQKFSHIANSAVWMNLIVW